MKRAPLWCAVSGGLVALSILIAYLPSEAVLAWIPRQSPAKWASAVAGFAASASLALVAANRSSRRRNAIAAAFAVFGGTAMTVLLLGALADAHWSTHLPYSSPGIKTVADGEPSMLTMAMFALLMLPPIAIGVGARRWKVFVPGLVVVAVSVLAVVGMWFDVPWMYGYVPGASTAMAVPTAVMLALFGLGWVCVGLWDSYEEFHVL